MGRKEFLQLGQMHISLKLLCASIFVLTAMPRMGVKIGPLPIYAIDVLLALTFYYATQLRPVYQGAIPFEGFIKIILLFAVLSELNGAIKYDTLIEPTYLLIRTLLAVSLFFSVSKIIRSEADLSAVIKAALLGLIITSLLMIMTSLPFTRGIAMSYVFSNSFLEPAAEMTVRMYGDTVDAMRGRSLVGVSIMSGAFINIIWPLAGLLYFWPGISALWKKIAIFGCILAPFGVVMSYSRGAILGLFCVVAAVLFFSSGKARRGIIIAVLSSLTIFSFVGWGSEYFFFERVENRTQAMIENPYEREEESERIMAYIEPFEHLAANPEYFILGNGLAGSKIVERGGGLGVVSSWGARNVADHAVFAKAYYTYGMVASITYIFLVISGLMYLQKRIHKRRKTGRVSDQYAPVFFASVAGLLPWFIFGHAAVSQPRGAMMLFFVFGLLAALKNFDVAQRLVVKKRVYAKNGRHPFIR